MTSEAKTIPDDMAARVARLINEAEDMRQQAADDLKQIYADLREELKSLGWDGKHVSAEVAALKGAIGEMRLDDKAKEKREERGERIDDYVSLLTRARARRESPRKAAEAVSERTAVQVEADASAEATVEGQPSVTVATSAESAGEAVLADLPTNSEIASASQGEDEAHSDGQEKSQLSAGANVGGDHVELHKSAATDQAGAIVSHVPAALLLRPHCQRPDMCGSGTRDHCWSCRKAMQEAAA